MKRTARRLLPRGWIEWPVFGVVGYAYVTWTIKLLLKAESIRPEISDHGWTVAERIAAFPAFYFGVEPLTGLIFNALLWGWIAAKLVGLLVEFVHTWDL